jgi:bacterioferritin (cytochrome b1)
MPHRDYLNATQTFSEIADTLQIKDTKEDHTYFLEQQLRLIEMMGIQNYLQSQMA